MRKNVCRECGTERQYSEKYNAYFCPTGNKWLERECGDPDCPFCRNRPERPLDTGDQNR